MILTPNGDQRMAYRDAATTTKPTTSADTKSAAPATPAPSDSKTGGGGGGGASTADGLDSRIGIRSHAALTSCHQMISRTAALTFAMFSNAFASLSAKDAAAAAACTAENAATVMVPALDATASHQNRGFLYRAAHWEAGMIGQILYVEAQRLGLHGTGIGCFLDEPSRHAFGIDIPPPSTAADNKQSPPATATTPSPPPVTGESAAAPSAASTSATAVATSSPLFQTVYHFCVGVPDPDSMEHQKYIPYNYENDMLG